MKKLVLVLTILSVASFTNAATLSGPFCMQMPSTAKVHLYRLYYDNSNENLPHYVVGGRALVRNQTPLGVIVVSQSVYGGAFTINGGSVYMGLRVVYVPVESGTITSSNSPFDVELFIASMQVTAYEFVNGQINKYIGSVISCPSLQ